MCAWPSELTKSDDSFIRTVREMCADEKGKVKGLRFQGFRKLIQGVLNVLKFIFYCLIELA